MWLAFFLACPDSGDDIHAIHEAVSTAPYRKSGTDVILVVLDTLRADHLSQYGYALETSPGLAKFASVATQFEQAWAPASWTLPSTTTILTGQHPLRHGMRHPGDILPAEAVTLAERLRDAGWHTAGFSHNVSIAPRHGMNAGFDHFAINTGKVLGYPHARKLLVEANTWLADQPSEPTFMYLQPMNCHGPYKVPEARKATLLGYEPSQGFHYYKGMMGKILVEKDISARQKVSPRYVSSAKEQYDTAIRYETDEIGKWFDELQAKDRFDDALIIVTADHGEEFFEHGGFSHGYSLHSEVLHIPLFIKLPGQKTAAKLRENVSLADIFPTVLDVAGLPAGTAPADGRSLMPLLRGESLPAVPLIFEVDWQRRFVGQAILTDGWKFLRIEQSYDGVRDAVRLYQLGGDAGETTDVADQNPERVVSLAAQLDEQRHQLTSGIIPESRISTDDQKQLEALGYLE